jgi:hypothetical protein
MLVLVVKTLERTVVNLSHSISRAVKLNLINAASYKVRPSIMSLAFTVGMTLRAGRW